MFWENLVNFLNCPLTDTTIISTLAGTSVTVSVLFFSLAIVPLQNLSQLVSNDVYQLVSKSKRITASYLFVLGLTIVQVYLLVSSHGRNADLYLSLFLTVVLLSIVGTFFLAARRMLNFVDFVLPAVERDFKKSVTRVVNLSRRQGQNLNNKKAVLEQRLLETLFGGKAADDGTIVVSPALFPVLKYKLYTLVELTRAIVSRQQLTSFQKVWSGLVACFSNYLKQTVSDFKKSHDEFVYHFVEKSRVIYSEIETLDEVYFQVFVGNIGLLIKDCSNDIRAVQIANSFVTFQVTRATKLLEQDRTKAFDSISDLSGFILHCIKCQVVPDTNLLGPLIKENSQTHESITHSAINLLIHKVVYELLQDPKVIESDDLPGILGLLNQVQPSKGMTPAVFNDMSLYGGFNARGNRSLSDLYIGQILLHEDKSHFRDLRTILDALAETMIIRLVIGGAHVGGLLEQMVEISRFISALVDPKLFESNANYEYLVYNDEEKRYFLSVLLKFLKVFVVLKKSIYRHDYFKNLDLLVRLFLRCCSILKVDPFPKLMFYEFYKVLAKRSWGDGKNQLLATLAEASTGKVKDTLQRLSTEGNERPF